MAMAVRDRRGDGCLRLAVGIAASGDQEDMDELNGAGQQRLLFPVDGFVLLLHPLKGTPEELDLVESLRHEFDCRLYAG